MTSKRYSISRAAAWLVVAHVLAASPLAFAGAQRTFVSSTGNDAHSCSLLQPCRSFAAAIAQTNSSGEVIVLDSAGYGPVTISKAVSIIAPAGIYAGISVFSGDGITVNAAGAIVVLRGLSVNGLGGTHGISVQAAARLRVENCVVSGMAQDGVHHTASGSELIMLDSVVRDNGNFGINVIADASVVMDHIRSEHNDTSGFHIGPALQKASATISESVFAHNGANGILAESHVSAALATIGVERSVMSGNVGSGFAGTVSSSGFVNAALARNALNDNGSDGIVLDADLPGDLGALISENTLMGNQNGIHVVSGVARASANTAGNAQVDLRCDSGNLFSLGNNNAFGKLGSCVTTVPGI